VQKSVAPGKEFIAEHFETEGRRHLEAFAQAAQNLTLDGQRLEPSDVEVFMDYDDFNITLIYPLPPGGRRLEISEPYLKLMTSGYTSHLTVMNEAGETLTGKIIDAVDNNVVVVLSDDAPAVAETPPSGIGRYLWLGAEHIFIGFDHLLFLAGLLVVCTRVRSMLVIITSFTLAHSLTLGLAAFDVISLPSRWVEAAIAASIVYVGIENLVCRDEPKGRWVLTFVFGLIHGFGFASVLREVGRGAGGSSVAGPLFAFNVGIELGQIMIALCVLPLWWQLQKRWARVREFQIVVSGLIVLAGGWWLWQRLMPVLS
jgi:hydrogenase/urease accessory protein HupE